MKSEQRAREGEKGFTLIELMVVLIILGLLATVVIPKLTGQGEEAKVKVARTQIKLLSDALAQFEVDNGFFPTTEQGLSALVTQPTAGREAKKYRKGGYIDHVPKDPWENEYRYLSPGTHGPFDLISLGADGMPGGEDKSADINNWETK